MRKLGAKGVPGSRLWMGDARRGFQAVLQLQRRFRLVRRLAEPAGDAPLDDPPQNLAQLMEAQVNFGPTRSGKRFNSTKPN